MTNVENEASDGAGQVGGIRWFGLLLFVGHLALLIIGAVSLWRIAGGWWVGAAAAGLFVLAFAAMWWVWLAPGSPRRLRYRERFTANVVVGPAVIVLGSLASLWLPGLLALSIVLLGDALNVRSQA
ncbi:hypothetical protein G7085_15715 [Tessaracoccus sp. HDW20]|uniref:hypothetical protein n=1 Tax=Tessaracoccus coleopterorum TaxID=2714950 RepID=UPI0018D2E7F2|nr:hypothetical protein [Tessaracoccus coleopterorum]NHB85564.1 hypothetical protein [Tessaracoccus coleopterorum]